MNGPFLAFVLPETESRQFYMETATYWLQHGLMTIIPIYLLRLGGKNNFFLLLRVIGGAVVLVCCAVVTFYFLSCNYMCRLLMAAFFLFLYHQVFTQWNPCMISTGIV